MVNITNSNKLISLKENIITAISKLKSQNNRANTDSIYTQFNKTNNAQDFSRECVSKTVVDLITEKKIINNLNRIRILSI